MTASMRRILRNECAANRVPLVMSNSATKGVRPCSFDFLPPGDDDGGDPNEVGSEL